MVKAAQSLAAPKTAAKTARQAAAKAGAAKRTPRSAAKSMASKSTASKSTPSKSMPASSTPSVRQPRAAAKATPARRRVASSAAKPVSAKPTGAKPASAKPAGRKVAKPMLKQTSGSTTQSTPVNLGFLSGFVGFHLRLAQDASYRAFARIKEKEMVKPGRFTALAIIHLNPGISQSALGRAIARDKSTVSPLIKDLQKNGLITRKPSPSDRRSVTLVLTKKGERILDRLHTRALEHEADLDKLVGTAKARLIGMLDKITGGFVA